jgi:hypothetical protein
MAQPSSRQELIDYCLRKLGAPVINISIAEEQLDDLIDDALQLFYERHFDGTIQAYLKYQIRQEDIDRAKGKVGFASTSIDGYNFTETANYIKVPPHIIGINKIFNFSMGSTLSSGLFNIKYQLFLNDLYYWGSMELLSYTMVQRYLEDIDWILTPEKMVRFNKRGDKLYLDINWSDVQVGNYIVLDCYRAMDPTESSKVWNDSFIKRYATAIIKRQWGQNLIKYQGMKLPGGVEFNGRQIYDDAQKEIDIIMERMTYDYEMPAFDLIG